MKKKYVWKVSLFQWQNMADGLVNLQLETIGQ